MSSTAGVLSALLASLAFLVLTVLLLLSRQSRRHGVLLILTSLISLLWSLDTLHITISTDEVRGSTGMIDTLRILSWGLFVHAVITLGRRRQPPTPAAAAPGSPQSAVESGSDRPRRTGLRFPLFAALLLLVQLLVVLGSSHGILTVDVSSRLLPGLWVLASLSGLVLVEALYRRTEPDRRYAIRHLCLGLVVMFGADFLVFTDSLLFRRITLEFWTFRALLFALAVPLIALSVGRNRDWSLRLHLSREAATGSVAVLAAGFYLVATALASSFIRFSGFSWASVGGTAIVVLAIGLMVVLLFSRNLRARTRVFLSKHLFSFKYDYRREWLNFTNTLARDPADAPASILKGLSGIVDSDAAALWGRTHESQQELLATRNLRGLESVTPSSLRSLDAFLASTGWIIDLDELRAHPDRYADLELPDAIQDNRTNWLLVPLPFQEEVIGIALIARSPVLKRINWEDRDLLKTAGHQAAGLLAQRRAHSALGEARQFEGFSKLSAYIVHDLKNILGQQSLIVSNARKHKHKPEFIDDAIATIDNSVSRMHSMLAQLRAERTDEKREALDIGDVLREAIARRQNHKPIPECRDIADGLFMQANREKTRRVFSHLIQNAQEATEATGHVRISLRQSSDLALVEIQDNGQGMSKEFVRDRLFRPFESTKGLTGMGIGAFESREHVRALGGDIVVDSHVGRGSTFTVELPLTTAMLIVDRRYPPDTVEDASNASDNLKSE